MKDINVKLIELQCIDLNEWIESSEIEDELDESDDTARKVRFDDSEDKRTTALNGGFEVIGVDRPKGGTSRVEIKG